MVTPDARRDGKVTREVVLSTALDLIDRDGADGLSMRRLARALNCDDCLDLFPREPTPLDSGHHSSRLTGRVSVSRGPRYPVRAFGTRRKAVYETRNETGQQPVSC